MLLAKYGSTWSSGFREDFWKLSQNLKLPKAAMFVVWTRRNEQTLKRISYRCFLPSLVPLAKVVSEEKIFENQNWELPMEAMFVVRLGQNDYTL